MTDGFMPLRDLPAAAAELPVPRNFKIIIGASYFNYPQAFGYAEAEMAAERLLVLMTRHQLDYWPAVRFARFCAGDGPMLEKNDQMPDFNLDELEGRMEYPDYSEDQILSAAIFGLIYLESCIGAISMVKIDGKDWIVPGEKFFSGIKALHDSWGGI